MASDDATDLKVVAASAIASLTLVLVVGVISPPLSVFAILFAIICGLAVWSPVGVLCAALIALPWFYRPVGVGTQAYPASELLLITSAVGAAARVSILALTQRSFSSIARKLRRIATSPLVLAALILTIAGVIGVVWPYDGRYRAESLREWRWVQIEPLILLTLATTVVLEPRTRKIVAMSIIAGAGAAALYGVGDVIWNTGVTAGGVNRVTGPYPHPNAFAMYVTRCAALAAAWMVFDTRVRKQLLFPTIFLVAMAIASYSRGALLALAAVSAACLSGVSRRLKPVVVALPITASIIAVLTARDRMLDLLEGGSGSLRLDIWTSSLHMIGDRPVRGYGPDQFLYAYLPRYIAPTAWQERFTSHAHNIFLDFWIRLGIIGFAFIVCAVVVCLVALVRVVRRPESVHPLRAACIVALLAVIVHGVVDNTYFSHDLAMSAWLFAWLAFGPESSDSGEGADTSARPGIGRRRFHWVPPVRQSAR